jgi:trehalose synthase
MDKPMRQTEQYVPHLDDYATLVGADTIARIRAKAASLRGASIAHISSTSYGGGVATLLSSVTLLLENLGIHNDWRVIQGTPEFFQVTKRIHNGLQGGTLTLSAAEQRLYEQTNAQNALRTYLDQYDMVIVHDPQPLPMIAHYQKRAPWVWRCHIDLTNPRQELWSYIAPFIEQYDLMVVSLEEYRQLVSIPQVCITPTLDPFTYKNQPLTEEEIHDCLTLAGIPTDLPLVVQVSRFDRWKDPQGVIEAFKQVCNNSDIDATLVLVGSVASDDPEGEKVFTELLAEQNERILVRLNAPDRLINALQRKAAVVLQKSLREGFGLTVIEAMWKGTPVIGGNVGGIRYQIADGVNGFLVSSVDETADRIRQVLQDEELRARLSQQAHETVRKHFLLAYALEHYLDLALTLLTGQTHSD